MAIGRKIINVPTLAGILLILFVAGIVIDARVVVAPRAQLTGESIANHSFALQSYSDEYGIMPGSYADLERAGILKRLDPAELAQYDDERATGKYQLTLLGDTHVLYYSDDIVVNWSADVSQFEVRDSRVVNRETGRPEFLLCTRGCLEGGFFVVRWDSSLTLYYELLKTRRLKE